MPQPDRTAVPDLRNPDFVAELGPIDPRVSQALQPEHVAVAPTMEQSIARLHRLPFIPAAVLRDHMQYREGGETYRMDNASFPVDRIVGVQGFQSWAGRGLTKKGNVVPNGGFASASAIQYYAETPPPAHYQPSIMIFKDAEDVIWGFTDADGAHRTAAAKLRGESTLPCTVTSRDYDHLPTVDFRMGDVLLDLDRRNTSFLGRMALRVETRVLAEKSREFEINREHQTSLAADKYAGGQFYV